jgi:putative component of membrane protein insertase Oxa1/YidC/SpoIIIJ protein YidD
MGLQALLAIKSIQYYQKYISPRKGYFCAYRVLHNELSCSNFCINEIERNGIFMGIRNTIDRLKACKIASSKLKEKRTNLKEKVGNSAKGNSDECKNLDTCDKLMFVELVGEAACCIFTS